MTGQRIISAASIAEAISLEIGSYVDECAIEFIAVDGNRILCWYVNAGQGGIAYAIDLSRSPDGSWIMALTRQPEGVERPDRT